MEKGYKKLIYARPRLQEKNTFAQKERLNAFTAACDNAKIRYVVTEFPDAAREVEECMPCAFICPTDIYAIKLLSVAEKYKAGIVGFDNIRLIDELDLKLDSVSYDVISTAKTAVDHIVNGKPVLGSIPYQLVKRGSI